MSDSSKRPGTSRDISELKARLGLKKGGAPAPAAKNGGQGVVPPPGVSLPAPPGVSTAPAGPVVPSAKDDPFGAMNAMAQIGTMQRAPEIVIVNDGRPVEHVGASKRAGTIVKYVVIGLVPLVIGVAIGQIAKEAKIYNAGISDARKILTAKDNGVKDVKKKVVELQAALETAAKTGFTPDKNLTATLSPLVTRLEVKSDAVFRAKQNSLNAELSGQILAFYAGVAEVRSMLAEHVKTATLEDIPLGEARKAADGAKGTGYLQGFGAYRYGVVIVGPSETDPGVAFGAKLVELGPPYCADGTQSTSFSCPNNSYSGGIPYRSDAGGQAWIKGEPQTGGNSGEIKKVIPLLNSGVADGFIQGGKPGASEVLYVQRLEALKARVDELIKTGNTVETKLAPKTKEDDKFTFFL